MTLEQLCTNLELSKELRELGYPQEGSLFYYRQNSGLAFGPISKDNEGRYELVQGLRLTSHGYIIAAPTASELGEMLPEKFYFQDRWYFFLTTWKRATGEYGARYKPNTERNYLPAQIGKTEADARAKMVIYLIKKSLITL